MDIEGRNSFLRTYCCVLNRKELTPHRFFAFMLFPKLICYGVLTVLIEDKRPLMIYIFMFIFILIFFSDTDTDDYTNQLYQTKIKTVMEIFYFWNALTFISIIMVSLSIYEVVPFEYAKWMTGDMLYQILWAFILSFYSTYLKYQKKLYDKELAKNNASTNTVV